MRSKLLVSCLVGFSLLAAACSGGTAPPRAGGGETAQGAEVRIAAGEDTWPTEGQGAKASAFAYELNVNVYEPLIVLGSDYSLNPGLAESWELLPPNTWRFHIRRGVKFHDGSDLTADDVMWSWAERQMEGKTLSTVVDTLGPDSVKLVDEYTVDITPAVPNLRVPEQILHPEGSIVPQGKHFDSVPPVGTGQFRVVEYLSGQSVVLERFEDYWGEKPKVQRMVLRFIPDAQARVEALRSGEVDMALNVPPDSVPALESQGRFNIVRAPVGRNQLIYINKTGQPPHDLGADRAIRQAVSLAINRQEYVDVVFAGNAEPGRWMAPGRVLGPHADLVQPVPFAPEEARRILDQAGWRPGGDGIRVKDGRRLELTLIGWAEVPVAAFQFLQAQLKEVGIDTRIQRAADTPTYRTYYQDTKFDLDLEVPNQNDGNPAFLPVLRMYSKSNQTQRFAPGGEFDEWAARALAAQPTDEVQRASAEMMRILINEEYIVVPLAGVYRIYATNESVELTDPHPSHTNQLWTSLAVKR